MKRIATSAALTVFMALSAGTASAVTANAFGNGGFEATTGATADGWLPAASGYSISNDAFSGSNALELASPQLNAAVALQNSVANGGQPDLIAGEIASFSFYSKGFAGTTGNVLYSLRFLDSVGNILYSTGNVFFQGDINPNTWTQITAPDVVIPVGANAAFVEFSQAIGPVNGDDLLAGSVLIDNVTLATVPEPGSLALLGIGGLAALRRRRSA